VRHCRMACLPKPGKIVSCYNRERDEKRRIRNYRDQVRDIFDMAPFIADLGSFSPTSDPDGANVRSRGGLREAPPAGRLRPRGSAGARCRPNGSGAAGTLVRSNEMVLTAEFKINLLRPALGDRLRCRATVLKPGRTLIVAESEVYAVRDGKEKFGGQGDGPLSRR